MSASGLGPASSDAHFRNTGLDPEKLVLRDSIVESHYGVRMIQKLASHKGVDTTIVNDHLLKEFVLLHGIQL